MSTTADENKLGLLQVVRNRGRESSMLRSRNGHKGADVIT